MGIDPGFDGAIAIVDGKGEIFSLIPMPIYIEKKKKTRKVRKNEKNPKGHKTKRYDANVRHIDLVELDKYLKDMKGMVRRVYLEQVHAWTGEGVTSAFRFGEGYGMIKGLLMSHGYKCSLVTPNAWTNLICKSAEAPSAKERSAIVAKELFPKTDFHLPKKRKPHDGMIDATLIAIYGVRTELDGAA